LLPNFVKNRGLDFFVFGNVCIFAVELKIGGSQIKKIAGL